MSTSATVSAQEAEPAGSQRSVPAPDNDESGWLALGRRMFAPDEGVPRFTIAFGGIKPGSGVALGPAFGHNFKDGSFAQATAEYSIHNYKLLQVRYQSRDFWRNRLTLSGRTRWQDAPSVPLYELGPDAARARALYGERKTEVSGALTYRMSPQTAVAAGVGYERFRTGPGRLDTEEDEHLSFVPALPGLSARTSYVHSFASLSFDSRATETSRSGWIATTGAHHYADRAGAYSFSQYVAEGERLIPLGRDQRGVLHLAAAGWISSGANVPFYLMPSFGGGDYLRGYRTYRFRDRDLVAATVEVQWRVRPYADAVVFTDAGVMGSRLGALRVGQARPTQGLGIRVHTDKAGLVGLDLARSHEGLQFVIRFASRSSAAF